VIIKGRKYIRAKCPSCERRKLVWVQDGLCDGCNGRARREQVKELTWKCHVCGEERPDICISVFRKRSNINGIDFQQNIRYCNDKQGCIDGAKNVDFLKPVREQQKKRPPRRKIVKKKQ